MISSKGLQRTSPSNLVTFNTLYTRYIEKSYFLVYMSHVPSLYILGKYQS